MRIGIIYCAYSSEEYVEKSLSPFLNPVNGHSFAVSAISYPFENFEKGGNKKTLDILRKYRDDRKITLNYGPDPIKETVARQIALDDLSKRGIDLVWMVDSDEFYSIEQIKEIIQFVADEEFITWFRICLKNRVFDGGYLEEPFAPPRIFRVKAPNYTINKFYDDNNVNYRGRLKGDIVPDLALANMMIPKRIAWVDHMTWLNDERSKKKVEYQKARGWNCSFKWNYEKGYLEFNEEYYNGKNFPTILKDEEANTNKN